MIVGISTSGNSDCYSSRVLPTSFLTSNINKAIINNLGSTFDSSFLAVSFNFSVTSLTAIDVTSMLQLATVYIYAR